MKDKKSSNELYALVTNALQSVYDPEFPLADIRTLGLIYDIQIQEKEKHIILTMTFTSPNCPATEQIETGCINAINSVLPQYTVEIQITFEPLRSFDKIKDPDLRRMFA